MAGSVPQTQCGVNLDNLCLVSLEMWVGIQVIPAKHETMELVAASNILNVQWEVPRASFIVYQNIPEQHLAASSIEFHTFLSQQGERTEWIVIGMNIIKVFDA